MANENSSRDNPSRQQSAERSQSGASQQGTGAQQGGYGGQNYGQGSQGQGSYGSQGRHGGTGQSRQAQGREDQDRGVGTSTWQGGRQPGQSGGPLATRGGSSMSPYYGSSGYGSGPFSVMRRISDEMDRLFENFGMGRSLFQNEPEQGRWDTASYGPSAPSMWSPHIEVSERNGKLCIQADLPGMKRDYIQVRIEDDEVIIQGERRQEQSDNQGGYYRSERSYGSFYRTIPLPEGTNADSANATFKDGVLEIEIDAPRQQQHGRTLEIREGSASQSGGHSGTSSGTTYGSGTTGSMEGTSGRSSSQHLQSGTSSGQQSGSTQHSTAGTGGSQQSSGSGTMYSGSGDPSVGAAGMGGSSSSSSDKSSRGSNS